MRHNTKASTHVTREACSVRLARGSGCASPVTPTAPSRARPHGRRRHGRAAQPRHHTNRHPSAAPASSAATIAALLPLRYTMRTPLIAITRGGTNAPHPAALHPQRIARGDATCCRETTRSALTGANFAPAPRKRERTHRRESRKQPPQTRFQKFFQIPRIFHLAQNNPPSVVAVSCRKTHGQQPKLREMDYVELVVFRAGVDERVGRETGDRLQNCEPCGLAQVKRAKEANRIAVPLFWPPPPLSLFLPFPAPCVSLSGFP
jgi:hypothetical protein